MTFEDSIKKLEALVAACQKELASIQLRIEKVTKDGPVPLEAS